MGWVSVERVRSESWNVLGVRYLGSRVCRSVQEGARESYGLDGRSLTLTCQEQFIIAVDCLALHGEERVRRVVR